MPRVSIITPCHNAQRFLVEAVSSVRQQSFSDWEHLIVDDGSTDRSLELAESMMEEDLRLKVLAQDHRGVSAARNAGFEATDPSSEFLYFFDADDVMLPAMLESLVGYLDCRPEAAMVYTEYQEIDAVGRQIAGQTRARYVPRGSRGVRELRPDEPQTPFASIYCWAPVMESLSLLRRTAFEQTARWDESLGQHGEGVDLFLQMALLGEIHYFPERLYLHRRHEGQSTSDAARAEFQQRQLYEKWSSVPPGIRCPEEVLRDAQRFHESVLVPHLGFRSALDHLKRGDVLLASRFWIGAIRRRLKGFSRDH